ncbi:uncharacterized protein LOC130928518 isoform X1 [Corythoichthys intestinalis]|uniref:uncharacterized protein LOC130928518 isoform X1 n=1 Tax=Corythoichthys intestinalis TaxID=161448 RepID=UPI0025A6880D|nr:uncharacterized protein LOC130928518 isoform X1 [Corythoichthys intestinalis]
MVESTVNQALLRCNYMNRLILKRKSRQAMTDDGTVELSQLCSHQETKTPPPPLDGTWGSTCAAIRRFDGTPERCVGARDLHTGLSLSEKCTGSGSSRTAYFMRFGPIYNKTVANVNTWRAGSTTATRPAVKSSHPLAGHVCHPITGPAPERWRNSRRHQSSSPTYCRSDLHHLARLLGFRPTTLVLLSKHRLHHQLTQQLPQTLRHAFL